MENIMEVQKQIKENASEVNDFLKVYFFHNLQLIQHIYVILFVYFDLF